MKAQYAKITVQVMLISLLSFLLVGCGESGSPGGDSGIGRTASISMAPGEDSLPADGKSSTMLDLSMIDSVGDAVEVDTSVRVQTNLGHFRNGKKEYKVETIDDSGTVVVQFTAGTTPGTAEIWAESNDVRQKVQVRLYDPDKVGSLSLDTGAGSIVADGSSQVGIFAIVTDSNGEPIEGLTVNFETTLGKFATGSSDPRKASLAAAGLLEDLEKQTTAVTDVDGEAKVMLTSGTSRGTANITVDINGRIETDTIEFMPGAPVSISLRAAPSTIKPGGETDLIARLLDQNGNPVEEETIYFYESGNETDGSLQAITAPTNVNGEAEVVYIAGTKAGEDRIRASAASTAITAETAIDVDPEAVVVDGITVTPGAPELVADGASRATILAEVTDIDGQPAIGKRVDFTTTAGTLLTETAETDQNGIARVSLQSTTNSGPARVRARCDGFIGETDVEFVPGPADHILMYAIPDVVAPEGEFEVVAAVLDKYDNRLLETERLAFLVREVGGTEILDSTELRPEDAEEGVYSYVWTAASVYEADDDLEITAQVSSEVSETVIVRIDPDAIRIGEIEIESGADSLVADGTSETTIRATVLDENDLSPIPGFTVDFSTTLGTLSSLSATTDSNGMAEVKLRAGKIGGVATVTADANGFKASTNIDFLAGAPERVSIIARPGTVSPNGTTTIHARILDGDRNPIEGETLIFSVYANASGGEFDSSVTSPPTDANGETSVEYTAGTNPGRDWIRATSATNKSVTDTTCVTVREGALGSISLTAAPDTITADGTSSTSITATVFDSTGAAVPQGTEITFETDLGKFSINDDQEITRTTADESGTVRITLISAEDAGTATVTATSGLLTQSTLVSFITEGAAAEIGSISLTADPGEIPADGTSSSVITANVFDTLGQPMPAGTRISFTTDLGTFSNGTQQVDRVTPDASGTVNVTLISADSVGTATVTASSPDPDGGDVTQSVSVFFTSTEPPEAGSIRLTANPTEIPANGTSSSTITATVNDTAGNPMPEGTEISFSTNLGTLSATSKMTTDDSGTVIVSLISADSAGTATVTATADGGSVSQSVEVVFEGEGVVPDAASLSIAASKTTIQTNGADTALIIALVLDANNVPIEGKTVTFSTTGGQISNASAITNADGEATVELSSGPDKTNETVTVTATADDLDPASIPIVITGTEITITPATAQLLFPAGSEEITIRATDADGDPIYNAEITITNENAAFTDFQFTEDGEPITLPATLNTDFEGKIVLVLTAGDPGSPGTVDLRAEGLGFIATGTYTIGDPALIFRITSPSPPPPEQVKINDSVTVTLHAGGLSGDATDPPEDDIVVFTTTVGTWSANGQKTIEYELDANNEDISFNLESDRAGVATVQVYDKNNPSTVDYVQITFFTPKDEAYDIFIDATQTNILPSTPTSQYSLTVEATVVDIYGNPVQGAIVDFYLSNTTGGGEYISPVSAETDATGVAKTTFTSGSRSTGSDPGSAVLVTARVATPMGCTDEVTEIECVAQAGGLLENDEYFSIYRYETPAEEEYRVWYNVDGAGGYTPPAGVIPIEVQIDSGESAYEVASLTAEAINAVSRFEAISYAEPATDEVTTIQCEADNSGDLGGTYFRIYQTGTEYYVWYDVNGSSTDPAPVGTGIEVDINQDDTATVVADKTRGAINTVAGFTANRSNDTVNVATSGDVIDATDVDTEFIINVINQGADQNSTLKVMTCGDVTDASDSGGTAFTINVTTQGDNQSFQEDDLAITITGGAANVSIGYASEISANDDNTLYLQPVSVLVADTNGNPVSGATVSLGLQPSRFRTGEWVKFAENYELTLFNPCSGPGPSIFVNEDLNNNATLDGDEDELTGYSPGDPDLPDYFSGYSSGDYVPGLNNGQLTPGQSVAGTIPSSVQTDENGVASFTLTYQKEYAAWVEDQIVATVMVYGTEYITKSRKWLPIMANENSIIGETFPQSPFNDLPCGIAQ